MARRVLVTNGQERYDLVEQAAPNEDHLREIMRNSPQLIPLDDLGLEMPMLVVGRETVLASGRIDLLGLARSGDIVIAEFKTGTQNSDFRHVLSQLIDYGSDLWRMSINDFDLGVVQRYFQKHPIAGTSVSDSLRQVAEAHWKLSESEVATFMARLEYVLTEGDFHFVVVAQDYRDSVVTSAQYLNATSRYGHFHLIQLSMLEGRDLTAYAAQVIASTLKLSKSAGSQTVVDEVRFLQALNGEQYRESMQDLFAALRSLGVTFGWGSKGTSFRIQTPDRSEPLSIGWAFPEGAAWLGLRHLSFGFDSASAVQTPTVQPSLDAFIVELTAMPGSEPIVGKSVTGVTFTPEKVPFAVPLIVTAIEDLVAAVSELGEKAE